MKSQNRIRWRIILCAAALGGLHGAAGPQAAEPEASVLERLKQLETAVETLKKENELLRQQAGLPAKGLGTLVKAGGKEEKLTVGGFIQGQAEFGDAPDSRFPATDRFLLRRTRLNFQGSFAEHFQFKLEGEFGNGSLSPNANYRAQLTDAYIGWNRYSAAALKIGQFKTPFGQEQLSSDTKGLTAERSLPNDRLTIGRQIGAGISGEFLESRLNYSAGVFNGNGVNNGFNDNEDFLPAARLEGLPIKTEWRGHPVEWSLGANAYLSDDTAATIQDFGLDRSPATAAPDNLFDGKRHAWGVDTQFLADRLRLQAEYLRAHFEPSNAVPFESFDAEGWHALVSYEIVRHKLGAVVRFESFDPNIDLQGVTTDLWTFGLNYYIKGDDLKFQLNYLLGDPAGQLDDQGRVIARMQLVF